MAELPLILGRAWIFLLVHLWQTSLVLLPILLLARTMRRAPARSLHWLWSIALAKTIVPFAAVTALLRAIGIGLSADGGSGATDATAATLATVYSVLHPQSLARFDLGGSVAAALSILWIAGVFYGLARLARGARTPVRSVGVETLPPPLRDRIEAARQAACIPRERLRVLRCDCIPHVGGLVRPTIRIPVSIIARLDGDELRAVLIHEETHRRRRDPARALFCRLVSIGFFFYPPVQVVLRSLHEATEWLCDERVLRAGVDSRVYGRALAKTIRMGLFPIAQPSAAGARGGVKLRARFDRILDPGRFPNMTRHTLILAGVLVLFAVTALIPSPIIAGESEGVAPTKSAQEQAQIELDKMPVMIPKSYVQPAYPEQERKDGIEGMVLLSVVIRKDGSVGAVKPVQEVEGHPAFTEASMKAVGQWRFEPGEKDGKAVECEVRIPVKFALDKDTKKDS